LHPPNRTDLMHGGVSRDLICDMSLNCMTGRLPHSSRAPLPAAKLPPPRLPQQHRHLQVRQAPRRFHVSVSQLLPWQPCAHARTRTLITSRRWSPWRQARQSESIVLECMCASTWCGTERSPCILFHSQHQGQHSSARNRGTSGSGSSQEEAPPVPFKVQTKASASSGGCVATKGSIRQ
jgi:hypothetical protein